MLDTKKLKLQDLTNILKDPAFKTNKNRSRLSKIYTSLFLIISDMLSTGISFLLAILSQYFILDYSMNDVFANFEILNKKKEGITLPFFLSLIKF